MKNILELLESDSRLTHEQIAAMCNKEVGDIRKMIEDGERDGIILGYKTINRFNKVSCRS